MDRVKCWEITPGKEAKLHLREVTEGIFSYLAKKLGVNKMRVVPTGGDNYHAEREQWNDANNVLAIRPGVVIGYQHNLKTIELMEKEGIKVLGIPGNQLGRGRGGARCMSCPIERDGI
jgi:arginine deiminase